MNHKNFDLQRFSAGTNVMSTEGNTNTATGATTAYTVGMGLSEEMKTYYSDYPSYGY